MKKMQNFTIDFLTGNTAVPAYGSHGYETHIKQEATSGTMYYPPVHLDDVYSVISKDAEVTSSMTSSLEIHAACPDDMARGTPSPNRDSGIESDHSPGHGLPGETLADTLKKLDQTAKLMKTKVQSTAAEKPGQSYLALIAKAIISSPDRKLTLGDIYKHIMDSNPYYDNGEKAWRGSIRYTLSINECFIKCGKDESGKGNFWGIHPNCIADFENGDYRRRQARRRAKKTLKGINSYVSPSPMTHPSSMYTPMSSAYMYNPYVSSYPYVGQDYTYGQSKPPGPSSTNLGGYSSAGNFPRSHPAFVYPTISAYGYMYPDYNASDSAYHREYETKKQQPQYETVDTKKWCLSNNQSEQSAPVESDDDSTMYNRIEIL